MDNKQVYDTEELYDHHMDNESQKNFMDFYGKLFSKYKIKTIHDCSIGAGGTTLPLAKLGYTVSGSDLSRNLLNRAKINFEKNGYHPDLFVADFRYFGNNLNENVDAIISTGNSLPHVNLNGFNDFLHSASKKLNNNGLLFFDIRNWDKMVREKPLIATIGSPNVTSQNSINKYMIFNWHDNGSVTFSAATSVYNNREYISLNVVHTPTSYPLLKKDIKNSISKNGYKLINFIDMDDVWVNKNWRENKSGDFDKDFDVIRWYGVLAQKL